MGRAAARLKSWSRAWRGFRQTLAVTCERCGGTRRPSAWRVRRGPVGLRLRGLWYCRPECLERALAEILRRAHAVTRGEATPSHRIPLGLLLLSRQQVTAEQLRAALEAQRRAGCGKIGEWLQRMGFSSEPEITAALARQWSCPVLRTNLETLDASREIPIPGLLLESLQMIPVEFVESTRTLLVAFRDGVDHTVLYAIEKMLGYRTEACLVSASEMRKGLETLAQRRGAGDVIFDRTEDVGECARIVSSYAARIGPTKYRSRVSEGISGFASKDHTAKASI